MTPQRYQRVSEIYHAALEKDSDHRAAFLQQACAGDDALRQEVESLLAAEKQAARFMTSGLVGRPQIAERPLAARQPLVGRTLGSYEVLTLLGAGGMGEVYLARDARLDRKVAIKLLPGDYCLDPERVWRFEREARAASSLNHP